MIDTRIAASNLKDQTQESPGAMFRQQELRLFIYLFIQHLTPLYDPESATLSISLRQCQKS